MRTEIHLAPQSQEEVELLEMLAEAREFALEEADLDPSSVAGIFAQMAAGIATEGGQVQKAEQTLCPECGNPMEDVEGDQLGGEPTVQPCGCSPEWGDIPPEMFMDE